ncbi:uncharacterized protein DDB_G0267764-like [Octopus bimaculoides]|uniref:uncharacterized protein DDB_G0267764-like n=1 Tax=Octopus bimaculoides TaxID=37653 RepID=UPI0022E7D4F7|nr:uncharacterized protein DDB_G0267764-like [Octopus bimaculoides]
MYNTNHEQPNRKNECKQTSTLQYKHYTRNQNRTHAAIKLNKEPYKNTNQDVDLFLNRAQTSDSNCCESEISEILSNSVGDVICSENCSFELVLNCRNNDGGRNERTSNNKYHKYKESNGVLNSNYNSNNNSRIAINKTSSRNNNDLCYSNIICHDRSVSSSIIGHSVEVVYSSQVAKTSDDCINCQPILSTFNIFTHKLNRAFGNNIRGDEVVNLGSVYSTAITPYNHSVFDVDMDYTTIHYHIDCSNTESFTDSTDDDNHSITYVTLDY